ncbi:hypothetical protein NKH77_34215 [Streptomyces sp. M19]
MEVTSHAPRHAPPRRAARRGGSTASAAPARGCGSHGEARCRAGRPDIAAAGRGQATGEGTLRWALDASPATFNAFQADADEGTERVAGAVLPTLFTADERAARGSTPTT